MGVYARRDSHYLGRRYHRLWAESKERERNLKILVLFKTGLKFCTLFEEGWLWWNREGSPKTTFGNGDKCLATILPTLFDSSQRRCRCKLELITKLLKLLSGKVDDFFFSDLVRWVFCSPRQPIVSIDRSFDQLFWLVLRRSLWHFLTRWRRSCTRVYMGLS